MTQKNALRISIVCFIALLCLYATAGSASAAQISGTVYESDGTTLITGGGSMYAFTGDACQALMFGMPSGSGTIDPDGSYSITEAFMSPGTPLPAGDYFLSASATGSYVEEWWAGTSSSPDCSKALPVTVSAGGTVSGKDFQLDAAGGITGTVYAGDGATPLPVEGNVYVYTDLCGFNDSFLGYFSANDGVYTIQGLPSGTYYLRTYNWGNYVDEWWAGTSSSTDCNQAQPVTVSAGTTVPGKDFQLDDLGAITGTVYESDGTTPLPVDGTVFAHTILCAGNWTSSGTFSANDGTYTIQDLPSGTYYLKAYNAGNYTYEWWAGTSSSTDCNQAQPVTVSAAATVSGKDFQLDMGGGITGTVYESDGTTPLPVSGIVEVYTGLCGTGFVDSVPFPADVGVYTIQNLPSGPYYLKTAYAGGNYTNEWWAGATSSSDCNQAQPVTVSAGATVSGKDFQLGVGGIITGILYESDGTTPLPDFVNVNAYTGLCGTGYVTGGTFIPNAGSYTIQGLPSGSYYLQTAIIGNYVNEWWAGTSSSTDCNQAQPVTVSAGTTVPGKDFQLDPAFFVSTLTNPLNGGLVTGGGIYSFGDTATLTAIPTVGYVFSGWSGDATGTDNPLSVTVDSDKNLTAIFTKKGRLLFPIRAKDGQIMIISM